MSVVLWIVMAETETQTNRYWVLQWEDGTYYCTDSHSGWTTISNTTNIRRAEQFDSEASAKDFHDGMGHFYGQRMFAVPIDLVVRTTVGDMVELPALERSIWSDRDD